MKTKLIIAGVLGVLVANAIALWCVSHHYEFYTSDDGRVIWRCNKFTGKAEYYYFSVASWVVVSEQNDLKPE